jgi:hypothetical protein
MKDLEHPQITKVNRTGYANLVNQPEHAGIDYFGNEILVGDSVIVAPNGEVILEDSFEDYLIEVLGFEFKTAE